MTELAELLPGVVNLHVGVKEAGDRVVFLRKVEPGKADRSYGIEVARLAGLPMAVVERARAVLRKHEQREATVSEELSSGIRPLPVQASIFEDSSGVLGELRELDVDELRPIEALTLLHEWKSKLAKAGRN